MTQDTTTILHHALSLLTTSVKILKVSGVTEDDDIRLLFEGALAAGGAATMTPAIAAPAIAAPTQGSTYEENFAGQHVAVIQNMLTQFHKKMTKKQLSLVNGILDFHRKRALSEKQIDALNNISNSVSGGDLL